jgi:hypothetical protein
MSEYFDVLLLSVFKLKNIFANGYDNYFFKTGAFEKKQRQ